MLQPEYYIGVYRRMFVTRKYAAWKMQIAGRAIRIVYWI